VTRLIAGRARGHRLAAPSHSRTRPTSDRVRESAFNLISDWAGTAGEPAEQMLDRCSFLALYAGTGAVGLEAASRGAAPVVCVERDRPTAALARQNASGVGLDVTVVAASVESFLAGEATPFDVVWLDPPYDLPNAAVEAQLQRVVAGGWLAPDGLLVVERSGRDAAPGWPTGVRRTRQRRYGETSLYLATQEDA